jgi:hypothetical protein
MSVKYKRKKELLVLFQLMNKLIFILRINNKMYKRQ